MECKQNLSLKLLFAKPAFFVGEFIKGTLLLETEKPSVIEKIIFEINMVQEWQIEPNPPRNFIQNMCLFNLDLDNGKTLQKMQNSYIMPGGKNTIPFSFKLIKEAFPCFEFPLSDKYGFLRYHFNVKIFSCHFYKLIWNHYLCLLARPVININNQLTQTIGKNVRKLFLMDLGSALLTVTIPDNNYKISSQINVKIIIDNINGKEPTKETKVKFVRIINFFGTKNEVKFTEEKIIYETKVRTAVLPGRKEAFECLVYLKERDFRGYVYDKRNKNPYGFSLSDINFYMPTVFSKVFCCQYELRASLHFNSFVAENDRPRAKFPIYIVHQTVLEQQTEIQRQIDLDKAKANNNKNINNNKNQILNNKTNNNNNYYNNNNNINNNNYYNNMQRINNNISNNNINNNANNIHNNENNIYDYNQNYNDDDNLDDNLPSRETLEFAHQNNITQDGNNIDDDYSNQYESAPVAFNQEPKNDSNNNMNNNSINYNDKINQNNNYNNNINQNNNYNNSINQNNNYNNNINQNNNYNNNNNLNDRNYLSKSQNENNLIPKPNFNNIYQSTNNNINNNYPNPNIENRFNKENNLMHSYNNNMNNFRNNNNMNNNMNNAQKPPNYNILENKPNMNSINEKTNKVKEEKNNPDDFCILDKKELYQDNSGNNNQLPKFEDINQI